MNLKKLIYWMFCPKVKNMLGRRLRRGILLTVFFILFVVLPLPVFAMHTRDVHDRDQVNQKIIQKIIVSNDRAEVINQYATGSNTKGKDDQKKEEIRSDEDDGNGSLGNEDNCSNEIIKASDSDWDDKDLQEKIEDKKLENENPQENFEDTVTNDQESENLYFNTSKNQKNSEQKTESISENQIRDLKDYVLSRGSTNELANFNVSLLDAGGITIEPDDNGIYHVYENDLYYLNVHFYAPMGIPEKGIYQYIMPEGIKAIQILSQNIRASDGAEIGILEILESGKILSISMKENKKIRLNVTFCCTVDFERENPAIKIESHKDGSIAKTGYFNGLTGQFEWTITAQIPAYAGGKAKEWSIRDIMYDPLWGDAYTWNLEQIKNVYIICNGKKEVLLDKNIAMENQKNMAYEWISTTDPPRLYILNKTTKDTCEGYCKHWYFTDLVTIIVHYESSLEESSEWLSEIEEESSLYNDAWLNNKSITTEINLSPILSKSHSSDSSKYTITLNPDFYDLSRQEVVIDDVMTGNAYYVTGSMTVFVTDKNGVTFPLQYGTDFTVEKVDGSAQHIRIHVANPGAYCYQFTYKTVAKSDGGAGEVKNEAQVTLWGREFCAEDYSFSSSAEEYFVRMKKSEEDSGRAVPGALYGLYSSTGELMVQGVTDALGECLFRGDPVNGFLLDRDCLYYLQEIEAPDGYEKNETRTWFYFAESDYEQSIRPLLEEARFTGVYGAEDEEAIEIEEGQDESLSSWILVTDRRIKTYTLPQTGGVGTDEYITVAFLIFAGMGSVFDIVFSVSEPIERVKETGKKKKVEEDQR